MNVLDQNIKDILRTHPETAETLAGFGIGCATCQVGTCRLRDIVEIHNLPPDREAALFDALAAAIAPGTRLRIPAAERKLAVDATPRKLAPPLQRMVVEHAAIKRLLARIPALTANLEDRLPERRPVLEQAIAFIRGYADAYHHAKEEDILFRCFEAQAEVVMAFRTEHEQGRGHVRDAAAALARGDAPAVRAALTAYAALLTEHIRREDDVLYPWMDRTLSDSQVGRLFAQCAAVDDCFGTQPADFERWVDTLEPMTR